MGRRRHTPEQIITALREAEVGLANGKTVREVIRELGIPRTASVADLGVGPGVFALPLARHLSEGLVYAVDADGMAPRSLRSLRAKAARAKKTNVQGGKPARILSFTRLGKDPRMIV